MSKVILISTGLNKLYKKVVEIYEKYFSYMGFELVYRLLRNYDIVSEPCDFVIEISSIAYDHPSFKYTNLKDQSNRLSIKDQSNMFKFDMKEDITLRPIDYDVDLRDWSTFEVVFNIIHEKLWLDQI